MNISIVRSLARLLNTNTDAPSGRTGRVLLRSGLFCAITWAQGRGARTGEGESEVSCALQSCVERGEKLHEAHGSCCVRPGTLDDMKRFELLDSRWLRMNWSQHCISSGCRKRSNPSWFNQAVSIIHAINIRCALPESSA